ncbi:MAG: crotonase/enoyl-CoA hydratase family protein [Actinomycetota bacterium]|nr:crotonase/enoyl-CoA hydratase family protein [Actinomycetota bacterium]
MSVDVDIRDGVMVVTLNRPEAANALNAEVGAGVVDAMDRASKDVDVRTVVITGAGEKIFSAGMDLKAFAAGEDMSKVGAAFAALGACPKPLIAAVNGQALAGGFEVVMRADLVVAADHARFGIPEVKRGLVAAGGGTRLPRRIPVQIALEMGLTGEPISAARALELGLINRVVPAAEVLDTAMGLATTIAANGPLAVQATKQLMLEELGPDTAEHVGKVTAPVFASDDAKEGARAFAEKRAPEWKGR